MSIPDVLETDGARAERPGRISRREFLRLSGLGMMGAALPLGRLMDTATGQLGRILQDKADVYAEASFSARHVKTLWRDDVQPISSATVGDPLLDVTRDPLPETNRVWYQLDRLGFVHSSAVQPVRAIPQSPANFVPYRGALAEVTLPFVEAYWEPSKKAKHAYRLYFETTHWVNELSWDKKGRAWYRIYDDRIAETYFVRAEGLRLVPLAELTPISPDVPAEDKFIEVNLAEQWVRCSEAGREVFSARVSTGEKVGKKDFSTPSGAFTTFRKKGSRHMAAGNLASGYDLPGVPWVSYITQEGISFHGTYWHNDFGTPRSHGCINMTSSAAKWLFRWTHPVLPTGMDELWTEAGTAVKILA